MFLISDSNSEFICKCGCVIEKVCVNDGNSLDYGAFEAKHFYFDFMLNFISSLV